MQAPPSIAADVRKLATVSACTAGERSADTPSAWSTTAIKPLATATATMAGRIVARARPTVAQYSTSAASAQPNARSAIWFPRDGSCATEPNAP